MLRLRAGSNGLSVDTGCGNIPDLWLGPVTPLHKAQWYGTRDDEPARSKGAHRLAGDFLCMPFGKSDLTDDPPHGFPASSPWEVLAHTPDRAHLRLVKQVQGAVVEKHLALSPEAPLLYQRHVVTGGAGEVTLALHPMAQARGARLAMSPKTCFLVPASPLEPGVNLFVPGARSTDQTAIPGLQGPVDLTRYPAETCEDFLTAVEAPGNPLGWTAVTRAEAVIFVLKDPRVLPITMFWFSNGGRTAAPWHGRHRGVLGIEDGIAAGADGHRAALGDNPVRREGARTCLSLGPQHDIRHVIGAIPRPDGWQTVTDIALTGATLTLTGDSGPPMDLPFDPAFFAS